MEIAIKLHYADNIKIEFSIYGNKNGKTQLELPMVFANDNVIPHDIQIYIEGKLHKKMNNIKLLNEADYHILLKHKPYANINVTYHISNSPSRYPYFNISKGNFFLTIPEVLIIPTLLQEEINNINFSWPSYKKAIVFNLGVFKNHKLHLKTTIQKLKKGFITGGDLLSTQPDSELEIIFIGNLSEDKKSLIKFIMDMCYIQDKFFDYSPTKEYFVIEEVEYPGINGIRIDGNVNSIAIEKGSSLEEVRHIISHEHLHKWFSEIIKVPADYTKYAWFIEGFTDYYAYYLNYLNGTLSAQDYLESYNQCIKDYLVSPFKNVTNDDLSRINEYSPIYRLPYLRGRIFAHELDYNIRKFTRNKYNLDYYIKSLIKSAELNKFQLLTNDYFIKSILEITGYNVSKLFKEYILLGNIEIKSKNILDQPFSIAQFEEEVNDYGFDFLALELEGSIKAVVKDSNAYSKGLRDGQQILGYDYDSNKIIIRVIDKNGKRQKVKFSPTKRKVIIPQYILTKNLWISTS